MWKPYGYSIENEAPYFYETNIRRFETEQKYILIGSEIIPNNYIRDKFKEGIKSESNYTIFVKKTSKQSIGWPYGQCVHYPTNGQLLGATSQTQCYRNCIKQLYKTQFNCIPLFVDKLLHESDINYLMTTRIKLCETSPQMLKRIRNINPNICRNKCPDDCRKVEYSSVKQRADGIPERLSIPNRRFVWNTQPMLAYIEEPVMTFTQFVVNCGGLMGLWFGKSAKDLIVWLIELKASNRINHFWINYQ